ncbi:MAG: polymer-forming cytoskeletal protein [Nitrospirae bacterium]|nr:polymer-forming cytoskeletal protein [Candidatus Troglogloeales bacterium]
MKFEGELAMEGPLSDVYSNDTVGIGKEKVTLDGDLISAVAIETSGGLHKPTPSAGHRFKVVSERVEIKVKTVADVIGNNPYMEKSKPVSEGVLEYDPIRKGSVLKGDEVYISNPLQVEGDLYIDTQRLTINAPLLVKGNVVSTGSVSVDLASPFEDAVVIDGNFEADQLTIVGKINVGGSFTAGSSFDLVGTLVVNGGITLKGRTKITYVDTIYKAALLAAQQQFGDTLLLHSQVFKNVKGANTVALFTFVKGYVQSSEAILLERIRTGEITPEDYFSVVIGASGQYGSELIRYEGVAPYYREKVRVIDSLKKKGYQNLEVVEAINVPLEAFYLTFREKGGDIIGTYLIGKNDTDDLVELTEAGRAELIKQVDNAQQAYEDTIKERNCQTQGLETGDATVGSNQKALFSADEPLSEEAGSPAEARTEEWRYTKNMPEERQEIEVEVEELGQPSVSAPATGDTVKQKSWWKRLKRWLRKIFPPCSRHVERSMIADVDEGPYDDWTKKIAVLNGEGNNCSPVSATMILRYHGLRKGNQKLYPLNPEITPDQRVFPFGENGTRPTLPLAVDLRSAMKTGEKLGTKPWNMAPGIEKVLSSYGIGGRARWLWNYTTSSLFDKFTSDVNSNNPPMFNVIGGGGWATPGGRGHTMPVLGTKEEHYSGTCLETLKLAKHWIYVHSTWWGGSNSNGLGDKRWYRLDWYNYPLALWDGVSISVD